ncbi:MAG: HAMP domain-containing sensor histidine kinase [Pseudomonadota bacterium]
MSAGILHQLQYALGALGNKGVEACAHDLQAIDQPEAELCPPVLMATARSIVVDLDGAICDVGRCWQHTIPRLQKGVKLIDLVHVADRVAWMRALSQFKRQEMTELVQLRVNMAPERHPQRFQPVTFALESCHAGQIRIDLWREERSAASPIEAPAGETELLAMMSHEFRTPLNAILGFSGLLNHAVAKALTDDQRAEYVGLIRDAAEHMLAMVNGILDVSKIGAGKYAISPEDFDFSSAVKEAVSLVSTQADAKAIKLIVRPNVSQLGHVTADRRAIKQVLINLLSNAVKFTPDEGCVTVDAWIEEGTLKFAVCDTGIGMNKEEQDKIFAAFSQLDNGTGVTSEGTGLGLCLVKGLVGLHGGEIDVSSSINVGTKMLVSLPHACAAGAQNEPLNENDTDDGEPDGAYRQSA